MMVVVVVVTMSASEELRNATFMIMVMVAIVVVVAVMVMIMITVVVVIMTPAWRSDDVAFPIYSRKGKFEPINGVAINMHVSILTFHDNGIFMVIVVMMMMPARKHMHIIIVTGANTVRIRIYGIAAVAKL